jgi:hypothetical protein
VADQAPAALALAAFAPLSEAEEMLAGGMAQGAFLRVGDGALPADRDSARTIRADLLRALLIGGDGVPAIHPRGLRLGGASVAGQLDLQNIRLATDVQLVHCAFDQPLILQSAAVETLFLDGSRLPGIAARRLEARGNLFMRGATVTGQVDLRGARIGGEVVLDHSALAVRCGLALEISYVETRGDLRLANSTVSGGVKAWGVSVAGDLILRGAQLDHRGGTAFSGNSARIRGDLDLREIRVAGALTFVGARIGTDVMLDGAQLSAPDVIALDCNRASVEGALFLRGGAMIAGALSLNGARVGALVDEPASWPVRGDLLLNRFVYGGLLASPVDAATRLDWLARQDPMRWGETFWPQPYEHLSRVLDAMGHRSDARAVLFRKERLQRRARRQQRGRPARALLWCKDAALAATIGYGLYPLRSFGWLLGTWAVGVVLLSFAAATDELRPYAPVLLRSPEWTLCAAPRDAEVALAASGERRHGLAAPGQSQFACFRAQPEAQAMPPFFAMIASAESLIPGLDAGQGTYWAPDSRFPFGRAARAFGYIQRLSGYTLGLLAVAGFSGLVRSR